jgi:hypothetical protein
MRSTGIRRLKKRVQTKKVLIQNNSSLNPARVGEKSSDKRNAEKQLSIIVVLRKLRLHINKPFEVCLSLVLPAITLALAKVISQEQPTSLSFGGQREKVSDEPGLKTQIPWVLSCITLREKP